MDTYSIRIRYVGDNRKWSEIPRSQMSRAESPQSAAVSLIKYGSIENIQEVFVKQMNGDSICLNKQELYDIMKGEK